VALLSSKHGDSSRQLCTYKAAALEATNKKIDKLTAPRPCFFFYSILFWASKLAPLPFTLLRLFYFILRLAASMMT
jgi:hypothetical protein